MDDLQAGTSMGLGTSAFLCHHPWQDLLHVTSPGGRLVYAKLRLPIEGHSGLELVVLRVVTSDLADKPDNTVRDRSA